MGEWKRSWETKRHYDRPSRRPPHPPHGFDHCSVPLWERKFCSYVGGISWQKFCDTKKFISMSKTIEQWDDSEAFENFQNAKARFWAEYHGVHSDIPLPDPDMYIDKVNHYCKIDPELIADLEREQPVFEVDSLLQDGIHSSISTNKLVPVDGWGNSENQSVNWDIYVEKPAEASKWEEKSRSNSSWGVKHESRNAWSTNHPGWGEAVMHNNWGGSSNDRYLSNNWNRSSNNDRYSSNNRNSSYGVCSNGYYDPVSGRKRNSWGYSQQRASKQKCQDEDFQRNGNWQDHRGRRNSERHQFYNRAY